MFELKKRTRRIGRYEVTTFLRDINGVNTLNIEAGTNGYQGGDSGSGSRTYFRVTNMGPRPTRSVPKAATPSGRM